MRNAAPYASTPIPVHFQSTNAPRYRLLSCVECAEPFLSREGDVCYRTNVKDLPEEAHVDEVGGVVTHCGSCSQQYIVFFSLQRQQYKANPLAYQQAQTIFLATEEVKQQRNTFCIECHHAYLAISDRVSMISDTAVSVELMSHGLGAIEVRCKSQKCKQRWQLRV